MNEAADSFFYRLGYWVATNAKLTLLICLVLVIVCCSGFLNFEFVTDGEDLWVPSDSLSKKQEQVVLSYFDDTSDYAVILVDSPSDGENILTKEAMDAIWELHSVVLEIETNGKTYEDLCTKGTDGVNCGQSSRAVTRFWDYDYDTYKASVTSDADVLEAINVDTYPDGTTVSLEAVFGNTLEYNSTTGDVASARAMMQMYLLDSNNEDTEDDAFKWMADYQDFMADLGNKYDSIFGVEYITSRSISDALTESVAGENILFVTTYLTMIVVVSLAIGRCRSDSVRRRPILGTAGVYVVVAAALAAYGLNSGFEVPFTTLSIILPFILVGIGVDDMFVIVAAFDHTDPDLPVEERVALGLKRCGVSITYTSMTNFFAFMLGSTTSLPAVEYFCLYAGTAILFDFFLQLTAFVAILTMDANRQEAGRFSFCCCFRSKAFLEEQEKVQRGVVLLQEPVSTGENGKTRGRHAGVHDLGPVGRFMKDKYTPAILSTPGKIIVLLGTVALLVAGIYGVREATQGFDVLDLAPDDHYARDYTELARTYELSIDSQFVPLGIYTLGVDYTDVDVQVQIQETDNLAKTQEFISGPIDSWLSSFVEWAAERSEYSANVCAPGKYSVFNDSSRFYAIVAEFVEDKDYERFQDDIVFKSDGSIEISRSKLFLVNILDIDSNVAAIEQTRDVMDESTLDPEPFGFSEMFIFTEQFLVIYDELILNFILALVAVAILSLFILGDMAMVVLICFTVVIIDVDLLGFVYHWGLNVNGITVIELIMAVGLVVDYMVHIVHFFLHQDPNIPKDARIADAMGEIGPSVMLGAATTFLGIMPLAFASNVIFRTFFKMFLIIITFGFFHGAVFIPVVLSLTPECCLMNNRGSRDGRKTKGPKSIKSSKVGCKSSKGNWHT